MKLCLECQAPAEHDHHIIPRSLGGTATVPLCSVHHAMVHGAPGLVSTAKLTSLAMQKKKAAGLYTGGRPPYGFELAADGSLVAVEAEQKVLALVREYHGAGMRPHSISKRLEARGITSRGGKPIRATQVERMVAA